VDPRKDIKKVEDLLLEGRRVFLRVDLDCPLAPDGTIADDAKIQAALPRIRYAVEQGAKVVLASSLGKPGGRRVPELSMAVVGERLAAMLGTDIYLPEDSVGDGPRKVVMERVEGEVVLLENLAFHPEESANDDVFAQKLCQLADVYVLESFAVAALPHASVCAMPRHFSEKGAGPGVLKELTFLGKAIGGNENPFVLLAGGCGVADQIALMNQLLGRSRGIAVGGEIAATFLRARGSRIGLTPVDEERVEMAAGLMNRAKLRGLDLALPVDVVVTRVADGSETGRVVSVDNIPDDARIVDIGPATIAEFNGLFAGARTVLWSGAMGRCLDGQFMEGTAAVAKALAHCSATSIVVGDDTTAAVQRLVLTPFLSHVAAGGDLALRYLLGMDMPGIEALREEK
jgi:phosphoglycerate kinase